MAGGAPAPGRRRCPARSGPSGRRGRPRAHRRRAPSRRPGSRGRSPAPRPRLQPGVPLERVLGLRDLGHRGHVVERDDLQGHRARSSRSLPAFRVARQEPHPPERAALRLDQPGHAGEPRVDQRVQLGAGRTTLLGRALHLDQLAARRRHHVHVHLGRASPPRSRGRVTTAPLTMPTETAATGSIRRQLRQLPSRWSVRMASASAT